MPRVRHKKWEYRLVKEVQTRLLSLSTLHRRTIMTTAQSIATPPAGFFSPLASLSSKDQKPSGSPYNPLYWPQWFSYHKNRLGLPNPGKFERLHGEVKGTENGGGPANNTWEITPCANVRHLCHQLSFWRCAGQYCQRTLTQFPRATSVLFGFSGYAAHV